MHAPQWEIIGCRTSVYALGCGFLNVLGSASTFSLKHLLKMPVMNLECHHYVLSPWISMLLLVKFCLVFVRLLYCVRLMFYGWRTVEFSLVKWRSSPECSLTSDGCFLVGFDGMENLMEENNSRWVFLILCHKRRDLMCFLGPVPPEMPAVSRYIGCCSLTFFSSLL